MDELCDSQSFLSFIEQKFFCAELGGNVKDLGGGGKAIKCSEMAEHSQLKGQ
jgi:hypothetical protein